MWWIYHATEEQVHAPLPHMTLFSCHPRKKFSFHSILKSIQKLCIKFACQTIFCCSMKVRYVLSFCLIPRKLWSSWQAIKHPMLIHVCVYHPFYQPVWNEKLYPSKDKKSHTSKSFSRLDLRSALNFFLLAIYSTTNHFTTTKQFEPLHDKTNIMVVHPA